MMSTATVNSKRSAMDPGVREMFMIRRSSPLMVTADGYQR
jgi:hypothetical protein